MALFRKKVKASEFGRAIVARTYASHVLEQMKSKIVEAFPDKPDIVEDACTEGSLLRCFAMNWAAYKTLEDSPKVFSEVVQGFEDAIETWTSALETDIDPMEMIEEARQKDTLYIEAIERGSSGFL